MRRRALTCLAALAFVLAGCGADPAPTSQAPASGTPAPVEQTSDGATRTSSPKKGIPPLLDFTASTVTGQELDGASLAGRPTVLWFWAPWCPTCRGQIPQVEALESEFSGDINVIGVGSLDSAEAIADFAGDVTGVTHLEDVDGELWKRFGVAEQSSFVVLGADGTVAFEAGYGGTDDLAAEVESLLG